jgi:hypothetical protein
MFTRKRLAHLLCLLILSLSSVSSYARFDDKKDKKRLEGAPVLWREPRDIASRDLYLGPGGRAMKPDLSSVKFVDQEAGGYSTKYHVIDGSGRKWTAKLSKEAQSETAANRLMWAVGFNTEICYVVPQVTIEGKGSFHNVRFEARPEHIKRGGIWKWDDNPFVGTKEFQGLKVMMILLENWDIKDDNNKILGLRDKQTGQNGLLYIISDLGGTFGKTGGIFSRSRNESADYAKAQFIKGVKGSLVEFHYGGKRQGLFKDITVEQARWVGRLLSRLSERQIRDAFRAANYSPEEIQMLTKSMTMRIKQLKSLGGGE